MKKKVFLFSFFLFATLFVLTLNVSAADVSLCEEDDEDCRVDAAYSCLEEKVEEKTCEDLSSEDRLFAFLATGDCKNEVLEDSNYLSDVRFTSIATLGLHNSGTNSEEAETWLIDQERNSIGIDWFLEVDTSQTSSCTVTYSSSNNFIVGDDKRITSLSGGSCLSLAQEGYWLEVNSNCYDEEFVISCDQSFLTTLLYQKQGSETIYVSETTHSSSQLGETTETVNSLCFKSGSSCDYEGSLWASLALAVTGNEIDKYLPYLITFLEDNSGLLPESFLYFLTGNSDFKNQLLSKQINNKWWSSSSDRYYGTALALYPLRHEESDQKLGAIDWLLNEAQNEDGCWDSGNIRSTGFVLASIWPRGSSGVSDSGGTTLVDCEAAGFSCTSTINCGGQALSNYYCSGTFVCCSQTPVLESCFQQGGEICNSNQQCAGIGSVKASASGLGLGQVCCVSGFCQEASTDTGNAEISQCESSGGNCRVNGCVGNEEEVFELSCDFSSDVCCLASSDSSDSGNLVWIWVLLILILLIVLAIVFRNKLRAWWIRFNSKSNKKGGPPGRYPRIPPRRSFLRKGGGPPLVGRPSPTNSPATKKKTTTQGKNSHSDLDDVLKKLKEMGK